MEIVYGALFILCGVGCALTLTRREQEIPHFYKWWDELRYSRRLLDFCISQYYNLIINQSYSLKRI